MVGKVVKKHTPRPVRRVTGKMVSNTFGGPSEQERINRDTEFIVCNLDLAIKLHWSAGIQELRKGTRAGGSVNDQVVRDKRIANISLLRDADVLINNQISRLPDEARLKKIYQIEQWTSNHPIMPSDFSFTELETLSTFADSMLARLYLEHLPGKSNPEVINALGGIAIEQTAD